MISVDTCSDTRLRMKFTFFALIMKLISSVYFFKVRGAVYDDGKCNSPRIAFKSVYVNIFNLVTCMIDSH